MKIYQVGGSIRDELLGLPVQDRDYCIVGATPQQMLDLGYQPVGKDFPVYLHPHNQSEYALARTERKVGAGYKGFEVFTDTSVSIEEDLQRRDLTINAIAKDEQGHLIDPYGGRRDIQNKVLRHVSDAFSEDPVRILRLARFAARFSCEPHVFTVAPETMVLMRAMVQAGEVDALVPERVWQEISRGLMEHQPSRMFDVLRECGALARIMPELDALWGVPQPAQHHPEIDTGVHVMMVLDYAASQNYDLHTRFAALLHDLGKGITPQHRWPKHHGHEGLGLRLVENLSNRLRAPSECKDLAIMVAREHGKIARCFEMRPDTLHDLFLTNDALRRPQRFAAMLDACECDSRGRLGFEHKDYPQKTWLKHVLDEVLKVNAGKIAQAVQERVADKASLAKIIQSEVRQARIAVIAGMVPTQAQS